MSAGAMLDALKQISVWFKNGSEARRSTKDMIEEVECLAGSFEDTPPLPRIVCLCGSTRFRQEFDEANERETLAGNIVLSVGCFRRVACDGERPPIEEAVKVGLDVLHKRKIDLADEVLVLNVGGYIGDSTLSEIEYAVKLGKPIRFLQGGYAV